MINSLTPSQCSHWARFRAFAETQVAPRAAIVDDQQVFDSALIAELTSAGALGALLPSQWGGGELDVVSYGLLSEELGRTCQSTRNFVAVEDMVASAILRWGTAAQRERWLRPITAGAVVAAFALTEPGVGSDAANVSTRAVAQGGDVEIRGVKRWISFGQIADVFLVFAQFDGKHTAFLVERNTPGLTVEPLFGLLGLRGSMLAELRFDGCRVPLGNMVGRPGAGLVFVASTALDLGRYSTAWGAVGLAQACYEAARGYGVERVQFGAPIGEHQLVARMQADMLTDIVATRLLCHYAGVCRSADSLDAENVTLMAKYRASTLATRSSADAVQIFGAKGVSSESIVERHFRDAKVLEIIEGTTQIQQALIGKIATDPGSGGLPAMRDFPRLTSLNG